MSPGRARRCQRWGQFAQVLGATSGGLIFLKGNEKSVECFKKRCGRTELCLGCREGADSRGREQVVDQLGDAHGSQGEGEGIGPRGEVRVWWVGRRRCRKSNIPQVVEPGFCGCHASPGLTLCPSHGTAPHGPLNLMNNWKLPSPGLLHTASGIARNFRAEIDT